MTTYTIRKGEHYSDACWLRKIIPHRIDKLERTVRFTESCLNTNSNEQINKLFGFTVGLCSPLWNSVRVGWNSNPNGAINLYAFWHFERSFYSEYIKQVPIDTNIVLSIEKSIYKPYINIITGCTVFARDTNPESNCHTIYNVYKQYNYGFRLFPYFGGELPAPHDIQILMK